jgi:hypothetical protein
VIYPHCLVLTISQAFKTNQVLDRLRRLYKAEIAVFKKDFEGTLQRTDLLSHGVEANGIQGWGKEIQARPETFPSAIPARQSLLESSRELSTANTPLSHTLEPKTEVTLDSNSILYPLPVVNDNKENEDALYVTSIQPEHEADEPMSATIFGPMTGMSRLRDYSSAAQSSTSPIELNAHNTVRRKPQPASPLQQHDLTHGPIPSSSTQAGQGEIAFLSEIAVLDINAPTEEQVISHARHPEKDHDLASDHMVQTLPQYAHAPQLPARPPPMPPSRSNPDIRRQDEYTSEIEQHIRPYELELPEEPQLGNRYAIYVPDPVIQYVTHPQERSRTVSPPIVSHQEVPLVSQPVVLQHGHPTSPLPESPEAPPLRTYEFHSDVSNEQRLESQRRTSELTSSIPSALLPAFVAQQPYSPDDYEKTTPPVRYAISQPTSQPGLELSESQYPDSSTRSPPPPFSAPQTPEIREPKDEPWQGNTNPTFYESGLEVVKEETRPTIDPDAFSLMNHSIAGESTSSRKKPGFLSRFGQSSKSSKATPAYKLPPNLEFCFSSCGSRVLLWSKRDSVRIVSIKYPFKDGTVFDLNHVQNMIPKDSQKSSPDIRLVGASAESTAIVVYIDGVST